MSKSVNLYVVVPCYNEEAVLHETSKQMLELFGEMKNDGLINDNSRIVFVDDGSKDKTWSIIDELTKVIQKYRNKACQECWTSKRTFRRSYDS